ncbi:SAP30-binding protein-like [Rhodnius prolixus]|uniref:SAP30-binding protein-like n=1 Tax=Rhodnius prolixus TaxID=13249 RepID=UPI003D18E9DA
MESRALASLNEFYSNCEDNGGSNYESFVTNNDEDVLEISSEEDVEFVGETKITDLDNLEGNDVELPLEPLGTCSKALQDKVTLLDIRTKITGQSINALIQERKSFRNPQIYEKLVEYLGIDELGTNYDPRQFDPLKWSKHSYYEKLANARREEMMRRVCNARLKAINIKQKSKTRSK